MKLQKTILALFLALLILGTCTVAGAAEVDVPLQPVQLTNDQGVSPQAAETIWYTRQNEEGKWQKRLWSITDQCWLTDWIDIDP